MKRAFLLVLLLVSIVLLSCSRREGKVIPRGRMSEIYAEMFVMDQLISNDWKARNAADTSWVYEPIFEKYGYTSDDYRASVAHYIKDPDRYARILRETVRILELRVKELKAEKAELERLEALNEENDIFLPERIYFLTGLNNPGLAVRDSIAFYVDSAGGRLYFDTREWLDTAFYGPVLKVDSLAAAGADSLKAAADSLMAATDSIAPKAELIKQDK